MIDHECRYYWVGGSMPVGGPSHWYVVDWDRRRVITVTMDGEPDDETLAVKHLSRYGSQLDPSVHRIYVSDTGELISTHTDAQDDQRQCAHYPFLHEISLPEGVQTVRRDELEELDRLGPDTDLVTYRPCSGGPAKKVVFKYYILHQYAESAWNELNLWMHLPRHPNIAQFDRIVVDELEGRVVGFTNVYVPGGSLKKNGSRVFKLKWLQQLIQTVDDLNLRFGVAHQDIAPQNLAIDEATDSIMLFDFNVAARIKYPKSDGNCYREHRNDVKGVVFTMYEIITRDDSLRVWVHHQDQHLSSLEKDWVKHPEVRLDHPVAAYRLMLQEWQEKRAAEAPALDIHVAPEVISNWPSRPRPPQRSIQLKDANFKPFSELNDQREEKRQDVLDRGDKPLDWERPQQSDLDAGTRLLSTGQVLNSK